VHVQFQIIILKFLLKILVLLSETGHAHLTDFNIAVHFQDDQPLRAVAGSMAYMGELNRKYFKKIYYIIFLISIIILNK